MRGGKRKMTRNWASECRGYVWKTKAYFCVIIWGGLSPARSITNYLIDTRGYRPMFIACVMANLLLKGLRLRSR